MQTVPFHTSPTALAVDEATERVVVTSAHNTAMMVDAVSGRILRTVPVGLGPLALAVDTGSGRMFVVNQGSFDAKGYTIRDGSISVLDALTGTVLQTVPLLSNAGSIVVDERAGRAFVVTHGRRLVRPAPTPRFAAPVSVTMIDATR